jgi:hypothetical protein
MQMDSSIHLKDPMRISKKQIFSEVALCWITDQMEWARKCSIREEHSSIASRDPITLS